MSWRHGQRYALQVFWYFRKHDRRTQAKYRFSVKRASQISLFRFGFFLNHKIRDCKYGTVIWLARGTENRYFACARQNVIRKPKSNQEHPEDNVRPVRLQIRHGGLSSIHNMIEEKYQKKTFVS